MSECEWLRLCLCVRAEYYARDDALYRRTLGVGMVMDLPFALTCVCVCVCVRARVCVDIRGHRGMYTLCIHPMLCTHPMYIHTYALSPYIHIYALHGGRNHRHAA